MSEWKNPDGSTSVGIYEDFRGFPKEEKKTEEKEPEKKPVKKTAKKK